MDYRSVAVLLFVECCFVSNAAAENYDYEIGLSYDRGQADSTSIPVFNGVPMPALGTTRLSSDSDDLSLSGVWYYSGLSDANGPKSRAAFFSRASNITVGYFRGDESGSFEFSGGGIIPPASGSTNTTTNSLSLKLRHVWRDSGWYALASIARTEFDFDSQINGMVGSSSFDANAYSLGVGKYIGKTTTVDLSVADANAQGSGGVAAALSFSHVGLLGNNWHYSTDLAFATSGGSNDDSSYFLRGSLFPSPDFEFGIGLTRRDIGAAGDSDSVEGFVSWFVRDHVRLSARYLQNNPDSAPGRDEDSDSIGVGVSVRF